MKFKFLKAYFAAFIFSISSLAHSALIEWEYDINQYGSNFNSTFASNDRFGFGFDENTDFTNIQASNLQMFYYLIDGTRYDFNNLYENLSTDTTSRFTFDGTSLSWNDSRFGPADGNNPGENWTWLRSSGNQAWIVSGVNTTFYFNDFGITRSANMISGNDGNRHDIYTAVSTNYVVDVPEPSTLAIFALGMIGLASRRLKKQS